MRLTTASRGVFRGEARVQLRKPIDAKERRAQRTRRGDRQRTSIDIAPHETALWDALRDTRAQLARAQGVPAYVIFHDATLLQMLRERPRDLGALATVNGVGAAKLARYGATFLQALAAT